MKKPNRNPQLPRNVLLLGAGGMALRWLLYAAALDGRRLLPTFHPLAVCLWLLTAAALLYIVISVWKLNGDGAYENNFFPSPLAAGGQAAAAVGILVTMLHDAPILQELLGTMLPGFLPSLWQILGFLSVPCLLAGAYCRLMGKKPYFLLHVIPCLFFVLQIVVHYRLWNSKPQLMSYVFPLFGTAAMALFAMYTVLFEVDLPRRRMQLGMGLAAVYFLAVSLSDMRYPWLYLGAIAWAATGLCTLTPKPLPPKPEESGEGPEA